MVKPRKESKIRSLKKQADATTNIEEKVVAATQGETIDAEAIDSEKGTNYRVVANQFEQIRT